MAEDSTASRKYICYQPLLLILKMSRMFGIAPLTFGSDGIKFSRAYYIYSLIFIAALKATIFVGFVLDVTNPDQSLRARTSTSRIIWLAYLIVLTAVTVVGCCESPTRCKCMLNALHRIEEIKDLMGGVKSTPSDLMCIYATIFMFLSVVIVLSLIDLQQNLQAAYMLNKEVRTICLFSFFYVDYVIELLLEFQFIIIVFRLTLILKAVNEALLQLLHSIEKGNKRVHTINNYMIQTKVTKPHSGYTVKKDFVSEEECRNEIRRLALVYELVCEVVRNVDRGHGLILLLLLQSFFLHFIMTPYYMINLYRVPDFFASIGQQIAWFHFHASNVILIVEPCHRVQQEMTNTRSLVSKLVCRTSSHGPLAQELASFIRTLTLDQPVVSPLGMCVLERPLVITILGVVSAYLVPRHYFSIPTHTHSNNTANLINNTKTL